MPRIKLITPETIIATIDIPVRITDINYGNHVGNDSFVSIIHEARMAWLKQHNLTELSAGETSLIMSGLVIEFKSESFYGDVLKIEISAGEISQLGFELYYKISATRNEKTILIANAKTDMVCFDYENKKPTAIPEILRNILIVSL
ncbi:MAG: thioesterase family protein [Bacteroidota bacterium]